MNEETTKLFDSELKVMNILWRDGDVPAKHVAELLGRKKLSAEQIANLRQIVEAYEE